MIKIESLSPNAEVVFTRADQPHPATVGWLLTREEFDTLKVIKGELTYSIDELEVVTVVAEPEASTTKPETTKTK